MTGVLTGSNHTGAQNRLSDYYLSLNDHHKAAVESIERGCDLAGVVRDLRRRYAAAWRKANRMEQSC